jgi:hypothetical protein
MGTQEGDNKNTFDEEGEVYTIGHKNECMGRRCGWPASYEWRMSEFELNLGGAGWGGRAAGGRDDR